MFIAAVVGIFVGLGAVCQRAARRLTRFSIEALQRVDPRPPVLFLRAFGDDQVPLRPSKAPLLTRLLEVGRRKTSLDQMLLDEVTPYGPLCALGSPGDRRPPYGAARGYFDDLSWQDAVAQLSNDGAAVIICLDDTDGIWWEVEHLVAERHLAKTLFLVHPKHSAADANARITGRLASHLGLDPAEAARLTATPAKKRQAETVLGFFLDGDGRLQIVRSASYRHLAYLLTIRLFLRQKLDTAALRKV